jgi:hypothetical protein
MRVTTDVHKRRIVFNRTWDMQVAYIRGNGYQATYFDCADEKVWSKCYGSAERAAHELDLLVDRHFGKEPDTFYVQVNDNVPVSIVGSGNALAFAARWCGQLVNPILT